MTPAPPPALAAGCTLPADTTNRVGRAVEFISNWTPAQYAALSSLIRDYIWSAAGPGNPKQALRLPAGILSSAYIPVASFINYPYYVDASRSFSPCDPDWGPGTLCTYTWYMSNHPSWVIRKGDRATPAWQFGAIEAQGATVAAITNATTAAGNNTLHFAASPATVVAKMQVVDQINPAALPLGTTVSTTTGTTAVLSANAAGAGVGNGDAILFVIPSSGITSGTTVAGNPTLNFAMGATFPAAAVGQSIVDLDNPTAIPAATTVSAINAGAGTVTMSGNAAAPGIGSGDRINFVTNSAENAIPLDISNAAVQTFMEGIAGHLLGYGFQGISIDNVTDRNDFDNEGVCSANIPLDANDNPLGDCAGNGGAWTAIYAPPLSMPNVPFEDGAFSTDVTAWLAALTAYVHRLNGCTSANVSYTPENTSRKAAHDAALAAEIAAVDIWYNETTGGQGDSIPSAGLIGGTTTSATISGTLGANSTTVTLTAAPNGAFVDGVPLSIAGAGPHGQLWLGKQVGAASGNTITLDHATSTQAANPTLVQASDPRINMTGQTWVNFVNFVTGLNGGRGVPQIMENSLFPLNTPVTQVIDWAVGTHLLVKPATNAHTYLAWYFDNGDGKGVATYADQLAGGAWPEFWWEHGAPIEAGPVAVGNGLWRRTFANGLSCAIRPIPTIPTISAAVPTTASADCNTPAAKRFLD